MDNLAFDKLQDHIVMEIKYSPPKVWREKKLITIKPKGKGKKKRTEESQHELRDSQPEFFSGSGQSFWASIDPNFGPLKKTYEESYCTIRSLDPKTREGIESERLEPLCQEENDLFEKYLKICRILYNDIIRAYNKKDPETGQPTQETITARSLYSALAAGLGLKSREDPDDENISAADVNKEFTKDKLVLSLIPKSHLANLTPFKPQIWGSITATTVNPGFISEIISLMGANVKRNSIDLTTLSIRKMDEFMDEMEAGFGHTAQCKENASSTHRQIKIYRGSNPKRGMKILFHGTQRGCKNFRNKDNEHLSEEE